MLTRRSIKSIGFGVRSARLSSGNGEQYPKRMQLFHWGMGAGVLTCFGLVQYKQRSTDKKLQGDLMFYHKSVGLLMGAVLIPRLAMRLVSKVPATSEVTGSVAQLLAAKVSHFGFYGLLVGMPVTGVMMGYYGGNGLPFFFTTIPGAEGEEQNKPLAGWAWKAHKYMGLTMEYLAAIHVGAVGFHALKGEPILARMTGGSVAYNGAAIAGSGVALTTAASANPSKFPPFPFYLPPF